MAWKDIGVAGVAMLIFYIFAESYRKDFFKQLEDANRRSEESQKRFIVFIEGSYKENTIALQELASQYKDHTRSKDAAMDMLKDKYKNS